MAPHDMPSSESSFSTSDPESRDSSDDCGQVSSKELDLLEINKEGMSRKRSHVPKRSHPETTGDSSDSDVLLSKRFMLGKKKETASLVQQFQLKSATPGDSSDDEVLLRKPLMSGKKKETASLVQHFQLKSAMPGDSSDDEVLLRKRLMSGKKKETASPGQHFQLKSAIPTKLSIKENGKKVDNLPPAKLMMMMPEDEHSLVIGRSDHEMLYSAMADVGKAVIKLSDSYNYVKKTYVENYNLSKKLNSTSDDLETARFQLSEETKEVKKLKLQLKELKQALATELEAKVATAVEEFKSSAEYEKALMDARDEGIEHCRYHIQSLRPQWDLSFLDHPPNPS